MKQLLSALAVTVTAGLISASAPAVALASPTAVPPAYALRQVSGTFPGEDEEVGTDLLDISADGNRVLYGGSVSSEQRYAQPVLFVHDRRTGENIVVDSAPGQPGTPGSWMGADDASLSADGSVVVWMTRDDDIVGTGSASREALITDLATGTTTRIARSAEAGSREAQAVDVSADGTRAAVLIADLWSEDPGLIEIVDLATGTVTASGPVSAPRPMLELSDDGGTVAWVHSVQGEPDEWDNPTWDTVLVAADADTLAPIATLPDHVTDAPSLDADGSQLAYVGPEDTLLIANLTVPGTPRLTVPTNAGSGIVHRPRLSGDGNTVVYDERKYDEGDLPAASFAVSRTSSSTTLIAGYSQWYTPPEGQPEAAVGDLGILPVPSYDGSVIAVWLDGHVVLAERSGDAPDTVAPVWPADAALTAEPSSRTSVLLSWPAATDDRQVRGYEITADDRPLTTVAGNLTSYDVALNDYAARDVVHYAVRAIDTSGNAGPSLAASARGGAQLDITAGGYDALDLSWEGSADPDVTGYRVFRADGGQTADRSVGEYSEWVKVGDVPAGGTTGLHDADLAYLTWFDYRVDLVFPGGRTAPWATRTSQHTDVPPAVELTVDQVRSNSARVTWAEIPASVPLDSYRVEYQQQSPTRETTWTTADYVDRSEDREVELTGLAPRTRYAVRVVALFGGGWPERAWTQDASVTTLSEGITSFDVQAPRTADGGALVLDSDLSVTATGEPGLQGSLHLWTSSSHPGEADVVLPMTEPTPGTYVIEPYRLDGTLAAVGWAEVRLVDGTRVVSRGGTVAPVSGRLDLAVATSPDSLGDLQLVLTGIRGTQRVPVTSPGTVSVPLTPGTWSAQLVAGDGEIVATRSLLGVPAATVVPLTMTPVRAAQLDVTLTAPAGQALLPGTLTVRDDQDKVLATRRLGATTPTTTIYALPGHAQLTLDYRFDDQTARLRQPRITVDSGVGRSPVGLALEPLPAASADVTVTGASRPVGGATVKLQQTADGRTFTTTATTRADGTAELDALAGAGTLSANADFHVAASKPAELAEGSRTALTLDLPRTPTYRVRPHLIVVSPDGSRVEQPMDWRTAYHFHATLSMSTGTTVSGRTISQDVAYDGAPGDRVELCADGRQANLPKGCASIVLGEDRDADVTVELVQVGSATADLVTETGAGVQDWSATIYRTVSGGRAEYAGAQSGRGAAPVLSFGAAGLHTITWSDSTGRRATSDVVVQAGSTVALGRVALAKASAAPADVSVQSLPDPVMPGSLLVVRVALPASDTVRTQLQVRLPGGTTAQPGTATVDGVPRASTVTGGTVVVPLVGRGDTTIRVPLTVGSDVLDGQLSAPLSLKLADGTVLDLPPLAAQVRRVSLEGPGETAGAVPVRGRAPAGTAVTVRDEAGRTLAQATAGEGGRWSATVQLHSPVDGATYRLVAVTTVAGPQGTAETLSEPLDVRFSTSGVEPVSISIDNSTADARRRVVTWDPRAGNAAPTLVYAPGAPITLTARFEDASRVRGFTAYIGSLETAGSCTATECTAKFPTPAAADVGDIAVGYTVDALPLVNGSVPQPTTEELVASVAYPFNAPEDPVFDVTATDVFTGRWSVQGMALEARSTVGPARDLGAPSADDLAVAAAVGVPVRNFAVTTRGSGHDAELVISADFSAAWLDAGATGPATLAESGGSFKKVEKVVKVGQAFKDLYEIAEHGADNTQLDKLQDFVDLNIRACQPEIAEELTGYIDDAKGTLVLHKFAVNALDWMTLAGGSFADGVDNPNVKSGINSAVKKAFKELTDYLGKQFIERAVERVDAVGMKSCDPRIKFIPRDYKPTRPVASPTWIYDPSGYVYEALGTQRLEGVTATVLRGASADGPWTVWDAEAFGQTNPQSTSVEGAYGWDVPQGWWKVRYEKDGYRTAESEPMQVLPERYGVNIDLHRLAAPALTGATVTADGAVEVTFDEWMDSASVRAALSVSAGTQAVTGTVAAVGEQFSPRDVALARTFRFTPAVPFGSGQVLTVTVPGAVVDHGGVALGADAVRTVTAPTRPDDQPTCGSLKTTVSPTGRVAKGTTVTVTVTGAPRVRVELRAYTAPTALDWLRAVLTGQADAGRPWVVVGSATTGADGRATFTYKANVDTLLQARRPGCPSPSGVAVVDVK